LQTIARLILTASLNNQLKKRKNTNDLYDSQAISKDLFLNSFSIANATVSHCYDPDGKFICMKCDIACFTAKPQVEIKVCNIPGTMWH
jgi:hypothetical protein